MTKPDNKVLLFVNGDLPDPANLLSMIHSNDILVAVDGGLHHIHKLGLKPDLIIGDLDSADSDKVKDWQKKGVKVLDYPADKNETDLELAMDEALKLSFSTIWVVAALGSRIDHTLGNIFLLTRPDLARKDVRLVDGENEVFIIRSSFTIHGRPGQRVSLLPIHGPVECIQTTGLQYPLDNETLYPEKTRGISNTLSSATASISIENGLLLCIHQISEPE